MSKNLRKNSSSWELLKHLFYTGTMWKGDAKLFMGAYFRVDTSSLGYKELLDAGYIEEHVPLNSTIIERNKTKSRRGLYAISNGVETSPYGVINITRKGITFLCDKDDEIYEINKTFNANTRFRTTTPKLFLNELKRSRVMNIFKAAGALVYKSEKPTLNELYKNLQEGKKIGDDIYFYTLPEFRVFDNSITPSASDRYNSSKCMGISLSKKGAFMVYLAEPGDNKFISFNNLDSEINIQDKVGYFFEDLGFNYGHLKSPRLSSNFEGALDSDIDAAKAVDAIVISDGLGMAYKMCIGTKNGKISDNVDKHKLSEISLHPNMLCHGGSVFTNIFVIPNSSMGISMLSYLLSNSGNDYLADNRKRVEAFKNAFVASDSMGPYFSFGKMREANYEGEYDDQVIYMPVFEINTLHSLAYRYFENEVERYDTYAFLTRQGMVDGIARAIRKPCVYYNMRNGSKLTCKRVYDYRGEILGEHKETKQVEAPTKKNHKRNRKLADLRTDERQKEYEKAMKISGLSFSDMVIEKLDPFVAEIINNHTQDSKDSVEDMRSRFKNKL